MKKKILFIINPISGVGRQKTIEKLIERKLDKTVFDYELAYTKAQKHAIELSSRGAREGFDIVVAAGGDGSVNEVGRSLVGTNSSLAILPCGSGNGTSRHLEIPMNLVKAVEVINRANSTMIDNRTTISWPKPPTRRCTAERPVGAVGAAMLMPPPRCRPARRFRPH